MIRRLTARKLISINTFKKSFYNSMKHKAISFLKPKAAQLNSKSILCCMIEDTSPAWKRETGSEDMLPLPLDAWCQKEQRTSSGALMGHSVFHTFSKLAERRLPRSATISKIVQWFILNLEIFYIFTLVCSSWCLKIQSADTSIKVQCGANHRSQ